MANRDLLTTCVQYVYNAGIPFNLINCDNLQISDLYHMSSKAGNTKFQTAFTKDSEKNKKKKTSDPKPAGKIKTAIGSSATLKVILNDESVIQCSRPYAAVVEVLLKMNRLSPGKNPVTQIDGIDYIEVLSGTNMIIRKRTALPITKPIRAAPMPPDTAKPAAKARREIGKIVQEPAQGAVAKANQERTMNYNKEDDIDEYAKFHQLPAIPEVYIESSNIIPELPLPVMEKHTWSCLPIPHQKWSWKNIFKAKDSCKSLQITERDISSQSSTGQMNIQVLDEINIPKKQIPDNKSSQVIKKKLIVPSNKKNTVNGTKVPKDVSKKKIIVPSNNVTKAKLNHLLKDTVIPQEEELIKRFLSQIYNNQGHPKNSLMYYSLGCTKTHPPANKKLTNTKSANYKIKDALNVEIANELSHMIILCDTEELNTTKHILEKGNTPVIIIIERCYQVYQLQKIKISKLMSEYPQIKFIHIHSDIFKAIEYLAHPLSPLDISKSIVYFDIYDGQPDRYIEKILEEKQMKAYYCHSDTPEKTIISVASRLANRLKPIVRLFNKLKSIANISLGMKDNMINYKCDNGTDMLYYCIDFSHRRIET